MADSITVLTASGNFQASFEHMIENNQEKMDTNLREITEDMRAWQKEMKAN
jgi:hypothetical protein